MPLRQLPGFRLLGGAQVGGARAPGAEPAPARRADRRRRLALDGGGSPRGTRLGGRDRVEQRLGVRVQRLPVHRLAGPDLAQLAQVHHRHPVADLLDQRQVVRDEQVGKAEFGAQPLEEVEHLGLDEHVERGDRLVADQQRGLQGHRAGDGDALRLPAGQLPRVPLPVPRRVQADQVEQVVDPLAARRAAAGVIGDQRLRDDAPHVPLRVQRAERVLEHELHVPPRVEQLAAAQGGQVGAAEHDGPGLGPGRLQDRPGERGLAGPGLPHDAEGLAGHDVERHAGHRLHDAALDAAAPAHHELLDQVARRKQRLLFPVGRFPVGRDQPGARRFGAHAAPPSLMPLPFSQGCQHAQR